MPHFESLWGGVTVGVWGAVSFSLSVGRREDAAEESEMIGLEKRVLARQLLASGLSRRAVSREVGVSRRTLGRWLSSGDLSSDRLDEPVRYRRRCSPSVSVLDGYGEWIEARLAEFPRLSSVRLFAELRESGYRGAYDQVRRYVRAVRPRPRPEPVVRFETPPGRQAQLDFADFPLPWGKRHALLLVLGCSRHLWFQFYREQTQATVMAGMESAFRYFGGVPAEVLFDQMKAVVTEDGRASGGELLRNAEFVRFASHWGFRIRACRPYRAQTKGKVERPVGYLREGFFYGRSFASDADLNAQALSWMEQVAQERIHGTTKEKPVVRFHRERPALGPLPARGYRRVESAAAPAAEGETLRPPRVAVERRPLSAYGRLAEVSR